VKIPRSLGRYEVVDLIGQGGMGALFRARDPRIGRYVAIKLLRRDFDTPELRDRFMREARAAGCLSHPNIVTIYDVGEDDGLPFIAMEYVRGETFVDLVGLRPPLPVPRKVQLIEEVCAGLAHAHESGIVHRDIKPANLILGAEGIVKILDFGIAKLTASEITQRGTIIGTLNYMSPEQITAATTVDSRADIFAVGAVLYELLSHQQAFPGNMPVEVLNRIVRGVPKPIADYFPDIDPRLAQVVERALEKDATRRFQTASAMQDELAEIRLNPMPAESRPAPPRVTTGSTEVISIVPSTPARRKTPGPSEADEDALRARQVDGHLASAAAAYDAGDYDAAIESCRQVLLLDGSEERAIAQLDRIHAAIDQQQEQGLAAEEAERLEEARISDAVDDARRRFKEGQHQSAIESLEALPASYAVVAAALEELTAALQEIEEQRLLQDRLERTLRDFDAELAREDLARARGLLKTAVALASEDPRVQTARKRLDQAVAAAAAKEAAEAREREAGQKLTDAKASFEAGDLDQAATLVNAALALVPQHPGAAEFSERVRRAKEERAAAEEAERRRAKSAALVRSASERLATPEADKSQLAEALREVTEALALDKQSEEAQRVKTAVEAAIAEQRLAARVKAVITNARARFANGKHQAAIRLLEDFTPTGDPRIATGLEELRASLRQIEEERRIERERAEKQAQVAALLTEVGAALKDQRYESALSLIAKAAEIDPAAPELATLTEQARAQEAAAKVRQEIENIVADVDRHIAAGDFDAANAALGAATALSPVDARVEPARQRIEAAVMAREAAEARARDLDEKNAAAEELLERGDLDGAQRLLNLAAAIDAQHARTVSLTARLQAARAERAAAEEAERQRRTVDELLAAAAQDLQNPDPRARGARLALQKIGRALTLAPDHPEAQALKIKADEMAAAQRQDAFVEAAIRNARSRFAMGKHQAAFKLLEGLDPAAHPVVADTLNELRATLREREDRLAAERAAAAAAREADASSSHDSALDETRVVNVAPAPKDESDATKVILVDADTKQIGVAVQRPRWGMMLAVALLVLAALIGLFLVLGRAGLHG